MSSHHYVREGQEPSLFIIDAISHEAIMSLLEWSPRVLVTLRALPEVLSWGIKIDAVLYSRDAVASPFEILAEEQGHIEYIEQEGGQSELDAGLHFLINSKEKGVNVFCISPSGYFDDAQRLSGALQISLFDDQLKWIAAVQKFEKWLTARSIVQIVAAHDQSSIQTSNLTKTANAYEVASTGLVRVWSESAFWVSEEYQAKSL